MERHDQVTNDELIQAIIEKEAHSERLANETVRDQKQIEQIKRSRTWKIMKPVRAVTRFFNKIFGSENASFQAERIEQLENQVAELEAERLEMQDELETRKLEDRHTDPQQLIDILRQKKADGTLVTFMDELIGQKEIEESHYHDALIYAARLFMNERTDQKNLVFSKVLHALNRDDIPEFIMRAGLTEEAPLPIPHVASFRGSLSERVRKQQLLGTLPEYTLENKQAAYDFVDQLGGRTPLVTDGVFSLAEIPKEANTVIKPVDGAGARGVYLIYDINDIIDMKRSRKITSLQELEESMQKDLTLGWVSENEWMTEELILENKEAKQPASDVKFYMFYGKVGLILEISRYPERKHTWWTATGERVRTGKYDEQLFKGTGVTKDEIKLAEQMSLEIPAPFIRIDFLRGENGLVFGEMTAKPGNYDDFDDQTDEWLGNELIAAEERLVNDLLAKKEFAVYQQFIESAEKTKSIRL